jgi:putative acetyltransferase
MNNITYLPYDPKYFNDVHDLILSTIDILNSKDYSPETIKIMKAWQNEESLKKKFSEGTYFLALDGSKVVGVGGLVKDEVSTMFVLSSYNNLGIGTRILNLIELKAIEKGIKKLSLGSTISAHDFYTKCGYKTIKRAIHKLDGNDFVAYEMEKEL